MSENLPFQVATGVPEGGIIIDRIKLMSAMSEEISRQVPDLAFEPRLFNALVNASNAIADEFARPVVKASEGMGLMAWLASDDVGISSKYMAWVLSYNQFPEPEFGYPHDPDDFGRCRRLVLAVPKFAYLIFEMREHSAQWRAVAENWDRWVELYDAEDGETLYAEMKAAYEK